MKNNRAKAILLLVLSMMTTCVIGTHISAQPVNAQSGALAIDAFTDKTPPYSGRGINQTSNAFSPFETIVIFASVTYNGDPVEGLLVAFRITAPTPSLNLILVANATNQGGLTSIEFRVPTGDAEQMAFGTWFVLARTSLGELSAVDTLTFKVGYLVTANVKTVEPAQYPSSPVERQEFTKGSSVGMLVTLKNIAMSSQNVTFTIVTTDALNQVIYASSPISLTMPPGNLTHPLITFSIPVSAAVGNATITVSLYNQVSGKMTAYSPPASFTFNILLVDIAVTAVNLSSTYVYIGQLLNVTVTVKNLGELTENFNVTLYYNETSIETVKVSSLDPGIQRTLSFSWNTSNVNEGAYIMAAVASQVPSEVNTLNNRYVAGQVTITHRPQPVPFNPRDLYIILWIIILVFLIALLALLLLRRRKDDESETLEQISYFM